MKYEDIIRQFIDFDKIQLIKPIRFTPDVVLTLLTIDDKKYVLCETDYFDKIHEGNGIKEVFNLIIETWLSPKEQRISNDNDLPIISDDEKHIVYALAKVN